MTLFEPLPPEIRRLLDGIPALIDKVFPLPGRFRSVLPANVAELSRLLTSGRGERNLAYMGRPPLLSAYLRYFVPWNLYRLCRLLPGLDLHFAAHDRITDLGCGPLTLACALWICRPDLRSLSFEFQCIDRSGPALDAGRKLFAALAGEKCPWKIHTVKGDINAVKRHPDTERQHTALVCAVNVFNEMYGDISRGGTDNVRRSAEKAARLMGSLASDSSAILVVEPGFPRCGEFISLLREAFLERGCYPLSPCPHDKTCPLPGGKDAAGKKRWCHFAFETEDAPAALHRLSSAAGLPKERAVLSFLFTKAAEPAHTAGTAVRIISDAFPLPPDRFGRYCCSPQGLVLLTGTRRTIENAASGALVNAVIKGNERDPKSGALLAELPGYQSK